MKITIINKRLNKRPQTIKLKDGLISVNITEAEAIDLIHSLTGQIAKHDSNSNREESYSREGTLFTIWVSDFRKTREQHNYDIRREEYIKKSEEELSWRTEK